MKRKLFYPVSVLFMSSILLSLFQTVKAIPAFARKYQISCQVCHSPVPRLKAFGETFAANGYRLTQYESPRYYMQAGDDKLSLLREVPLAIRFDGMTSLNIRNGGKVDFGAPIGLKLLSGGELSDKLSYYFYFFMSEAGEMVGIEDAFLVYHDLFGSGLNFYAGQFQVCDAIYKRELRLTLEDAKILTVAPGNSSAVLTYDRGIMFDYEIPKLKTLFTAEILNGSGIGAAGAGLKFDKDKYKNVMGRVAQPIGKNVEIGFFGYSGKELIIDMPDITNSRINMFGPNLRLNFNERFMVNMLYVKRTDSKVLIEADGTIDNNVMTQGGFAELIYTPKGDMSKWYLTGLFNWVNSDLGDLDYKSATLHCGYILRRNVRLFSELTWISTEEDYGKFSIGFMSGF